MELIELGKTGEKVPVVGLGTWAYTGGDAPLRRGVELGAFLIDTAEMYHTEDAVGRAVESIRDQVFIATKVLGSTLRYDQVLAAADRSLKRLNVDCIDLYQVHWPDPKVPVAETMGAMERLVDEGKVRYVGVSNFSVAEMREAQAAIKHPIVSNQVLYSLTEREIEGELLPYCQRNGVTVMAYTPLGEGALARPPRPDDDASLHMLHDVAEEAGKSMAQVALNWCIAHENVMVIPNPTAWPAPRRTAARPAGGSRQTRCGGWTRRSGGSGPARRCAHLSVDTARSGDAVVAPLLSIFYRIWR